MENDRIFMSFKNDHLLSEASMSIPPCYKFILIGSSGVGKTAILKRLISDTFLEKSQSTIGVEFETTMLNIDNQRLKLQVWDTAGQERVRAIAKAYYRAAVGVILVYDLTDRKSFEELGAWLNDIHSLCDPNAVIQLIGNKADLNPHRVVSLKEAENLAKQHNIRYLETSAKQGLNVRNAFVNVAIQIREKGMKPMDPIATKPLLSGDDGGGGGCC
jgi:small GTP-binding protein